MKTLLLVVALSCLAVFVWNLPAAHGTGDHPARTHWMRVACAQEDSTNCFWDARVQGNGHGHSFYAVTRPLTDEGGNDDLGDVDCHFYVNRRYASRHDTCEATGLFGKWNPGVKVG